MHSSRTRTVRGSGRPGGVSAQGGGVHLPPVNRITDRCKNITFPQLRLRAVNVKVNLRKTQLHNKFRIDIKITGQASFTLAISTAKATSPIHGIWKST